MSFQLTPILDEMKKLYVQPISRDRFQEYLGKLQGQSKGDLVMPIMGFNPMAKEHILDKIEALENLQAELLMSQAIAEFNNHIEYFDDEPIKVVLNLADDLKGGWTNHYATDFDSKFKINALVQRNFCTPYFWTSENFTPSLIVERTFAYLGRTFYWKTNPKPRTLDDYVNQEIFVSSFHNNIKFDNGDEFDLLENIFSKYKDSDDYSIIFNFFYGDEASKSLGYACYGIEKKTGFDYAKMRAHK